MELNVHQLLVYANDVNLLDEKHAIQKNIEARRVVDLEVNREH
jgi:hypothetical protein